MKKIPSLTNSFLLEDMGKIKSPRSQVKTRKFKALTCVLILLFSMISFSVYLEMTPGAPPVDIVIISGIPLLTQHKDTTMTCVPEGVSVIHPNNHAGGLDGIYGNGDDCPHCSVYNAPASIAMISTYRGRSGNFIEQDNVYDNGKSTAGEITGNSMIETEGVGMLVEPVFEIKVAFEWSLGSAGLPIIVYDSNVTNPRGPINGAHIVKYINEGRPILWIDYNGYPSNQNPNYPSPGYKNKQGHVKVIVGYDGKNTGNAGDDMYLIYDPWPEYNDQHVLPTDATKGPGDTWNPYWIPMAKVVYDPYDVHLIDSYPKLSIPEGNGIILVITGISLTCIFIVIAYYTNRKTKL